MSGHSQSLNACDDGVKCGLDVSGGAGGHDGLSMFLQDLLHIPNISDDITLLNMIQHKDIRNMPVIIIILCYFIYVQTIMMISHYEVKVRNKKAFFTCIKINDHEHRCI